MSDTTYVSDIVQQCEDLTSILDKLVRERFFDATLIDTSKPIVELGDAITRFGHYVVAQSSREIPRRSVRST